jgi:hypothetical protein
MTIGPDANCMTKETDKFISRNLAAYVGTRMTVEAFAVDFARRNAGQTDAGTLRAPNRTVSIPNPLRRTFKNVTRFHNLRGWHCLRLIGS